MEDSKHTPALLKTLRQAVVDVVVVGLMLSSGLGSVTYATSISVTTTADELNTDGDCSLREVIRAANRNTRVDGAQREVALKPTSLAVGTGRHPVLLRS